MAVRYCLSAKADSKLKCPTLSTLTVAGYRSNCIPRTRAPGNAICPEVNSCSPGVAADRRPPRLVEIANLERENEREFPFQSWPLHFERIYFLGADLARKQRRVIGSESKPLSHGAGGKAADLADVCDILDLAIAHPEPVGPRTFQVVKRTGYWLRCYFSAYTLATPVASLSSTQSNPGGAVVRVRPQLVVWIGPRFSTRYSHNIRPIPSRQLRNSRPPTRFPKPLPEWF